MSLNSLTNFWNNKSIKLSDSFVVLIKFNNTDEYKELYTCCGFTIPKIEYEEETLKYGNMEQIFLTPKYDSCKELTLEFFETWNFTDSYFESNITRNKETNELNYNNELKWHICPACTLDKVFKYINLTIHQKYSSNIKTTNFGLYDSDMNAKLIDNITIKILDNKLKKFVYKYSFDNLKIINYSIYNLEYQSDSPCKVTVNLAFEGYYKQAIDELVDWPIVNANSDDENMIDENDKKKENPNNMNDAVDPAKPEPPPKPEPTSADVAAEAIADVQKKKDNLAKEFDKKADKWIAGKGGKKFKNKNQQEAYENAMFEANEKLAKYAAGEITEAEMIAYYDEFDETVLEFTDINKKGKEAVQSELRKGMDKIKELNEEQATWESYANWDERADALQELELMDMDEDYYEMEKAHEEMEAERMNKELEDELKQQALNQQKQIMSRGRGPNIGNSELEKAAQASKIAEQQAQVASQGNETGGENAEKAAEEAKKKKEEEIAALKASQPSIDHPPMEKNVKKTSNKSSETSTGVTQPIIEKNTKTWKPQDKEKKQEFQPQKIQLQDPYLNLPEFKRKETEWEAATTTKTNKNDGEKRYRGITAEQLGKNAARQDLKDGGKPNDKGLNYDIAMTQFIMGGNLNSTPEEAKSEMEKFERGYSAYMAEHGTNK